MTDHKKKARVSTTSIRGCEVMKRINCVERIEIWKFRLFFAEYNRNMPTPNKKRYLRSIHEILER